MNLMNFEINSEYRAMDNAELAYILTNRETIANSVREEQVLYGNSVSVGTILNDMTPARKKVAMAAIELYKRAAVSKAEMRTIRNSTDIDNLLRPYIGDIATEESWVIFLNQAARVIKLKRISTGGLASTTVDKRVILKEALLCEATSIILSHNHPSGNIRPSGDDDRLTLSLKEAAQIMNIRLLDHVIISSNDFYSYADEDRL